MSREICCQDLLNWAFQVGEKNTVKAHKKHEVIDDLFAGIQPIVWGICCMPEVARWEFWFGRKENTVKPSSHLFCLHHFGTGSAYKIIWTRVATWRNAGIEIFFYFCVATCAWTSGCNATQAKRCEDNNLYACSSTSQSNHPHRCMFTSNTLASSDINPLLASPSGFTCMPELSCVLQVNTYWGGLTSI